MVLRRNERLYIQKMDVFFLIDNCRGLQMSDVEKNDTYVLAHQHSAEPDWGFIEVDSIELVDFIDRQDWMIDYDSVADLGWLEIGELIREKNRRIRVLEGKIRFFENGWIDERKVLHEYIACRGLQKKLEHDMVQLKSFRSAHKLLSLKPWAERVTWKIPSGTT